jgi:hypothetical protein
MDLGRFSHDPGSGDNPSMYHCFMNLCGPKRCPSELGPARCSHVRPRHAMARGAVVVVPVLVRPTSATRIEKYSCLRHERRPRHYDFIGFGTKDVTQPYKFMWFGDTHGPKPKQFIGCGDDYSGGRTSFKVCFNFVDLGGPGRSDGANWPSSRWGAKRPTGLKVHSPRRNEIGEIKSNFDTGTNLNNGRSALL